MLHSGRDCKPPCLFEPSRRCTIQRERLTVGFFGFMSRFRRLFIWLSKRVFFVLAWRPAREAFFFLRAGRAASFDSQCIAPHPVCGWGRGKGPPLFFRKKIAGRLVFFCILRKQNSHPLCISSAARLEGWALFGSTQMKRVSVFFPSFSQVLSRGAGKAAFLGFPC